MWSSLKTCPRLLKGRRRDRRQLREENPTLNWRGRGISLNQACCNFQIHQIYHYCQAETSKACRWGQQWGGNQRRKEEEEERGTRGEETAEETGKKWRYRGYRRGEAEKEERKAKENLDRGRIEGEGGDKKGEISDYQGETESQVRQEEGISHKVWTKVWLNQLWERLRTWVAPKRV